MDITEIYKYIPALIIIALFCYGFTHIFNKNKYVSKNPSLKMIMPPVVGLSLATVVPTFFPENTPVAARMVIGSLSGMNMGLVVGLVRRYVKIAKTTGSKGIPAVIEASASLVSDPVDQSGRTLTTSFDKDVDA